MPMDYLAAILVCTNAIALILYAVERIALVKAARDIAALHRQIRGMQLESAKLGAAVEEAHALHLESEKKLADREALHANIAAGLKYIDAGLDDLIVKQNNVHRLHADLETLNHEPQQS